MRLELDRASRQPLAQQIADQLRAWIRRSRVRPAPGRLHPPTGQEQQLSQSCVIDAYDRLVALGLLESRHGAGFLWPRRRAARKANGGKSWSRRGASSATATSC